MTVVSELTSQFGVAAACQALAVISPSIRVVSRKQVFDDDRRIFRNQHPKLMLTVKLIELHYRPLSGLPFH